VVIVLSLVSGFYEALHVRRVLGRLLDAATSLGAAEVASIKNLNKNKKDQVFFREALETLNPKP
jgi:uncharacterized protein YggE